MAGAPGHIGEELAATRPPNAPIVVAPACAFYWLDGRVYGCPDGRRGACPPGQLWPLALRTVSLAGLADR